VKRKTITARWTKAHRTATGDECPSDAADIRGNAAADEAAKDAALLHPTPDSGVRAGIDFYTRRAPHVVAAVTAAMAMFPRAPANMARVPKPAGVDEARKAEQHLWHYSAGAWRCKICNDYVTSRTVPQ
jgi:hypothetical protein